MRRVKGRKGCKNAVNRLLVFFYDFRYAFGSGVSSHSDWGEAVSSDVSLVDGGIAFAFLHLAPETVGNRIHNPSGDVLCGRIERKHIVQHRVVRTVGNHLFYQSEIGNHPV